MPENFLRRWARRKTENAHGEAGAASAEHVQASAADAKAALTDAAETSAGSSAGTRTALPSMKDVASLAADADYSPFLARGVDKAVRRAAMKKLFSDPHFNVMDGLDIYIDDYTKPSPLPPGMLENLLHAKSTLEPKPLYETHKDDDGEQDRPQQAGDNEPGEPEEAVDSDDARGAGDEPAQAAPEPEHEVQAGADAEIETAAAEAPAGAPYAAARDIPINSTKFPHT
ncbi:DUF3306 domain-containing protein [Noviherbaspirillum sp. CPCC 100848]|uniref:DUF3306 domain-containing protein n=1 Tax=Noviherbaspirillum album TaxID=3080276 RepID=A0ABU6J329_9BURK|nr:DUF3306 domain-containing protein [Noviherbaspirillum sp. CPCC 100848]MEC4717858.1 DUF3306 domain-containing protein [Noviherbaspirillum sp. CPCC 100848]